METKVAKFSFVVPEGHPEQGNRYERTFSYQVCTTEDEARQVIADKKSWSIVTLVNDNLKANARANAYQAATLPFRPSEVPQEDIIERMVRDYIRIGVPEDIARKQVLATLEAMKADVATEDTGDSE